MNGVWRDVERQGLDAGVARVVYLDAPDEGIYGCEMDVPGEPDDRNYRATRKAIYEVARMLGIEYRTASIDLTREGSGETFSFRPAPGTWPEYPLLPGLYRIEFV